MKPDVVQKRQHWKPFEVLSICAALILLYQISAFSQGMSGRVSKKQQAEAVSQAYKIARVFSQTDKKGFTLAIVTLDAGRFNDAHMKELACQLNKEFPQVNRLKAGLLDDENAARLFLSGALEMTEFERARRGLCYLDRTNDQEYIQFSPERGRPKQQVKIRMKCD
jgi:hypothetical protein